MKTLWHPQTRITLSARINRLTPETPALWGRMNAEEMVAHATRELVTRGASVGEWSTSIAELHATLDRFASREGETKWPEHPVFGALTGRAWGALGWRHLDHHLRQFGV